MTNLEKAKENDTSKHKRGLAITRARTLLYYRYKDKSIVRAIVGYRERSKTRWISIVEWPDAIRLLWFLKVKRRRSPFHRFRNYAFRVACVPD